jgi:hypothetical protein
MDAGGGRTHARTIDVTMEAVTDLSKASLHQGTLPNSPEPSSSPPYSNLNPLLLHILKISIVSLLLS